MTEQELREIETRGSWDQNAATSIRALIAEVRRLQPEPKRPLFSVVVDPTMPADYIEVWRNGKVVGAIHNIAPEGSEPNPLAEKF